MLKKRNHNLKIPLVLALIINCISPFYFSIYSEDRLKPNNLDKNKEEILDNVNGNISESDLNRDFYLIGPGDLINLKLFDAPELSGSLTVLNDGTAQFPLIGSQYLKNLTIEEASTLLEKKYRKELLRPELHLTIKKSRPIKVSVVGEVVQPGIYSLIATKNNSQIQGSIDINTGMPRIIEALQKAGGITQNADLKKVSLMRRMPGNKKEFKKTEINLLDIILKGDQEQNLLLFDGDIIKLNKASEINNDIKKISRTNISPTISVNVVGQVNRPGLISLRANTPLVQAIYMAGGPIDWKANTGRVELLRINENGSASRKKYKINLDQDVSTELNPPLMNEDIIYVRSNTITRVTQGIGVVTEPLSSLINSYALFKLLE